MPRLTDAEKQHYNEQGYVIAPYRLSADALTTLRAALERIVAANANMRPEHLVSAHVAEDNPEGTIGDRAFLDLAHDPDILDMVEDVLGPDFMLWGAHMFCKPGGNGMEVPMHQDGAYWPIAPLATASVWVAIDDVDVGNGCMRFIPGSHQGKRAMAHHHDDRDDIALSKAVDQAEYDDSSAIDVELKAGEMSLHDVYLIHGSNANRSDRRRAGIVLRYMPTTSLFDRHKYPPSKDSNIGINFAERPMILMRGVDRHGGNDFETNVHLVERP
ncbi:MAG: phytanoyl-CoA dioxygenase family protein [Pikeienuella sp.]